MVESDYEMIRMLASEVREMNVRKDRVAAAERASDVAYHAAELVQYASKVEAIESMIHNTGAAVREQEAFLVAYEGDVSKIWYMRAEKKSQD